MVSKLAGHLALVLPTRSPDTRYAGNSVRGPFDCLRPLRNLLSVQGKGQAVPPDSLLESRRGNQLAATILQQPARFLTMAVYNPQA